jgi:hypothetical protein
MTIRQCAPGSTFTWPALVVALLLGAPVPGAADTLPARLTDAEFRALIERASEPDGPFQSDNLTSNEDFHQNVIPAVRRILEPGGVYVGVGPEQNFTYIAAFRPKVAFIVDIRRQNTVLHLYYKALFELSADRATFLARLFSRDRPAALGHSATVGELFDGFAAAAPVEAEVASRQLQEALDLLAGKEWFPLTADDRAFVTQIHAVFREFGPATHYTSRPVRSGARGLAVPTYAELMTAVAPDGRPWSYLASEEAYGFVRDLQRRNLIVPLTGDFGGATTLRQVADYVDRHQAAVRVFYVSNVEQYLFQGADSRGHANGGAATFYANVAALPRPGAGSSARRGDRATSPRAPRRCGPSRKDGSAATTIYSRFRRRDEAPAGLRPAHGSIGTGVPEL